MTGGAPAASAAPALSQTAAKNELTGVIFSALDLAKPTTSAGGTDAAGLLNPETLNKIIILIDKLTTLSGNINRIAEKMTAKKAEPENNVIDATITEKQEQIALGEATAGGEQSPEQTSPQFAAAAVAIRISFGGEIRTCSEVNKILCDSYKATSAQLTNGEIIEAKNFITDIHPQKVIQLIESKLIRPIYRERVQQMENSMGNFTLYLKFKANTVPYLNYNYYYYASEDVWQSYHSQQDEPQSFLYMHQCSEDGQQYAQSAEIMIPMDYREVAKWTDTYTRQRGSEYLEFKQQKAERVLNLLGQLFPGINSCIENYESSSPLTYRDYTATTNGSTYGILHDKNAMEQTQVSQRTKIPNLIMTGQNIHWHGMLGVTVSAMLASRELTVDN